MNTSWNDTQLDPIIEKSAVRCTVGAVSESGWEEDPFAGAQRLKMQVSLTLAEPAKTTDGGTLYAGMKKTDFIDLYKGLNGAPLNEDIAKRDKRGQERAKELAIAVLGLKRNTREDVAATLEAAGGWAAVSGKEIVVRFGHYTKKDGGEVKQVINGYSAVVKAE